VKICRADLVGRASSRAEISNFHLSVFNLFLMRGRFSGQRTSGSAESVIRRSRSTWTIEHRFADDYPGKTRTMASQRNSTSTLAPNLDGSDAWLAGDYLLMPDHLHIFCAPRDFRCTIETWSAYWKREFRLKHKRPDWKFQSRGWHHRLRDGESYSEKWLYVQENPLRRLAV